MLQELEQGIGLIKITLLVDLCVRVFVIARSSVDLVLELVPCGIVV